MNMLVLRYKSLLVLVLISLSIGVLVCALVGCGRKEPVLIGYAVQLTGEQSDIGVQWRNGIELAVDKINSSGGINGRPIKLVIHDDNGTPEGARSADRELIKSGVVAIIGHGTSAQTEAALLVINAAHIMLISPGASSPELSTLSNYYFQVNTKLDVRVSDYAYYIYKTRGIKRIAIIYDSDNTALSKPYREYFASIYKSLGGKIVSLIVFSSKTKPNFSVLVKKLRAINAEGLLIIAGSYDTAFIAQRARLIGWDVPLFSSFWADLDIIKQFGGKAVEGITVEQNYDLDSKSPEFLAFKTNYQKAYGSKHIDTSALGYETIQILAAALKKTGGSRDGLREALLDPRSFKGLMDNFSFEKIMVP